MPEPTGYSVSYSFSGWQATNPSRPLPAGPVDTEFANIAVSIASLIDALGDVRRSDGGLATGSVGLDQLATEVRSLFGDPRVLVSDLNPASFATPTHAAAGAANDKIMTPLGVKQALDELRAFASQGEAEAGAAADKVLSPASGKQMLDALRGLASQVEAETGADDAKMMTPLRTKQAFDKLQKHLKVVQALTWAEIAAGASQTQTVTCTGALAADPVTVGLPGAGIADGLVLDVWVSATHTISVRLRNVTGSPITPATGTWGFKVQRF